MKANSIFISLNLILTVILLVYVVLIEKHQSVLDEMLLLQQKQNIEPAKAAVVVNADAPDSRGQAFSLTQYNKQIEALIHSEFERFKAEISDTQRALTDIDNLDVQGLEADQFELQKDVNEKVDTYLDAGVLGDADMEALLSDISELNEVDRKLILKRLVTAMNTGKLKAHF